MKRFLEIPYDEQDAFVDFIDIDPNLVKQAAQFINKNKPIDIGIASIFDEIEKALKLDTDVLVRLLYTLAQWDRDLEGFLDLVYNSYSNIRSNPSLSFDQFKKKFKSIIQALSPIKLALKASILADENEKTFEDSRVITDIRPVFNNDVELKLDGSIIVHNLKLSYLEADDSENHVFITMTGLDLDALIEQLQRAKKKEEILKLLNL
jgi:hypothetical protein